MATYSMQPVISGTRLRADHNTFAIQIDVDPSVALIQSFNMNDLLLGASKYANSSGSYVI